MTRTETTLTPQAVLKKWIVRRPNGGCQVLFPLSELDRIVDQLVSAEVKRLRKENALFRRMVTRS